MAGTDGAGDVHAICARIARLAADGSTPAGASNGYVTQTVLDVTWKPNYSQPNEIDEKNGQGVSCVSYLGQATLKRYDITIRFCSPDEELEELLAGGTLITASGATIGYQIPAIGSAANPNGVSIELFSRAIIGGAPASVNPYRWWVLPRVFDLKRDDYGLADSAQLPSFTGQAVENTNYGNGPWNDWRDSGGVALPSGRILQRIRTASLPTAAIGYVAVPTQA